MANGTTRFTQATNTVVKFIYLRFLSVRSQWLLPSQNGADSLESLPITLLQRAPDVHSCLQVCIFLLDAEHSHPTVFTGIQFDARQPRDDIAPFLRQVEHAANGCQFPVDRGHLHLCCLPESNELTQSFGVDMVQREACQLPERSQVVDGRFVERNSSWFFRFGGSDERQELVLCELPQSRDGLPLPNPYFTLGKCGSVSRFHLFGHPLVGLLRALPYRVTIPGELVPPVFALRLFVDRHHLPPFAFLPLPFGRPPILPHSLNCRLECFLARALPPMEPVLRKYSITLSGMRRLLKS